MFQNLRIGAPIYILHKNEPKLTIGEVTSVSSPIPQFGTNYQNGIIAPPKTYVDVVATVSGEEINLQKLPADVAIADFGNTGMVVSESKDAMMSEIDAFKELSARAIAELPKHEKRVAACEDMIAMLNPKAAIEAEQARDIEGLKADMAEIKSLLKSLGRSSKKQSED